jgi:eukaryotic-like serine/threonine-protein kinase
MGNTPEMAGGTTWAGALPPRYEGGRQIARGGMGEIVLAQDRELNRPVVLKLLGDQYAHDAALVRRFTREAHAAARLSGHPHVVTIYDVGEWESRPFIAMEHVAGGDLRARLDGGPVEREQAVRWLRQAASALDDAHALGVVHRDVKPANLLLDANGDVRVGDFGIARVVDEATAAMTLPGTIIGTAGYLSPEQARGEVATAASDLYSLGVVAFELLTGRRPFQRVATTDELSAHVNEPPPSARSIDATLPVPVDAVLARVLAKDPGRRYPTATAFVDDLEDALVRRPQAVAAAPTERIVPLPGGRPRWRMPALAALLAAMLAIGFLGVRLAVGGGSSPSVRTVTREVTRQGTTTVQTVTQPATSASSSSSSAGATVSDSVTTGRALNDQGYALMQAGQFWQALPLLQRSVRALRGTGYPYEAYANYNLGFTLLQLGRCNAALGPLFTARRLEKAPEVKRAIHSAQQCASGHGGRGKHGGGGGD